MEPPPTAEGVVASAAASAFGRPLVQNNLRALLAEAKVNAVLPENWTWASADLAGWDFRRADGIRPEVKQSSVRQTWTSRRPTPGSFDIRARTGYFIGSEFVAEPGRNAETYVFAHHRVADDTADHRDPLRWRFRVVRVSALPLTKTISLVNVRKRVRCDREQDCLRSASAWIGVVECDARRLGVRGHDIDPLVNEQPRDLCPPGCAPGVHEISESVLLDGGGAVSSSPHRSPTAASTCATPGKGNGTPARLSARSIAASIRSTPARTRAACCRNRTGANASVPCSEMLLVHSCASGAVAAVAKAGSATNEEPKVACNRATSCAICASAGAVVRSNPLASASSVVVRAVRLANAAAACADQLLASVPGNAPVTPNEAASSKAAAVGGDCVSAVHAARTCDSAASARACNSAVSTAKGVSLGPAKSAGVSARAPLTARAVARASTSHSVSPIVCAFHAWLRSVTTLATASGATPAGR